MKININLDRYPQLDQYAVAKTNSNEGPNAILKLILLELQQINDCLANDKEVEIKTLNDITSIEQIEKTDYHKLLTFAKENKLITSTSVSKKDLQEVVKKEWQIQQL